MAKVTYASISSLSARVYGEIFNSIIAHIHSNSLIIKCINAKSISITEKKGCGQSWCVCEIIFTCAGAIWSTRANKSCEVPMRSCMLPNLREAPRSSERTSGLLGRKTLRRSSRKARDLLNDEHERAASIYTPSPIFIKITKPNDYEDIHL